MKAFERNPVRTRGGLASSFSLTEKWSCRTGRTWRAQPDRYPDSRPGLAPAFPVCDQWQWESV